MSAEANEFEVALAAALARWGIALSPDQVAQLRRHYELMLAANKHMNLTRITAPVEAAVLHYADSLALLCWAGLERVCRDPLTLPSPPGGVFGVSLVGGGHASGAREAPSPLPPSPLPLSRGERGLEGPAGVDGQVDARVEARVDGRRSGRLDVLDVGTGAGFPAIPLAVLRPEWRITAIDSTGKKIRFVEEALRELALSNVTALHARSEHWHPPRPFEVVLLRAVAPLAEGMRKVAHLVRPGGYLIAYKSPQLEEPERAAAMVEARRLHLREVDRFHYDLHLREETISRALWVSVTRPDAGVV
ncbi:MAG TPA: 16S rRNA (guanine(527)-N(7))-methyltransferase RsmG [Phycisphaerae bacterium]|nr:16S rRNA (guanine(527)-N(7))-methyltransferase RsmG [Phycisphaerae bacterium]HNU47136.1 16S rRNA (guanine(527)-N(7))-methyltransferase RsmG [Phycisphaerae bacterium]